MIILICPECKKKVFISTKSQHEWALYDGLDDGVNELVCNDCILGV